MQKLRLKRYRGIAFNTYFNRAILSTQFVARQLSKNKQGNPDAGDLQKHIQKPGDKLRDALADDLRIIVPSLLKKAINEDGFCYLPLYELTDPELIEDIKAAKDCIELILSNADGSKSTTCPDENRTLSAYML